MSLITGPYYQGDPDQKVEQYGDFDYVQYSLFSNLENIFGIDHSSCVTAFPMWENAGGWAYDYSMGSKILLGAGSYFQKGYLYSGLSNSSLTKNWSEVAPIAGEDFTICIPYIKTYPSGGTYRKIFSAILGDTGVDIFINQWSASIAFQVKVSWNATTLVGTNSAKEYSCCCVREGGENLILYENGEAVATGVKAGSLAKSITPTIGNYEGLLKGLMYFKKAISADQAHALSEYPSRLWQPAPQKTYFIPSGSPLLPINLTATEIITGAPVLGSPALGQTHQLSASGIIAGLPSVGAPIIGQAHNLTVSNIITGKPVLGSPTIGQSHNLIPSSLVTDFPVLGTPAINQIHNLLSSNLDTSVPDVGTPAIGQTHELAVTGITAGVPSLETPILSTGGTHNLFATDIVTGAPILGLPIIKQTHALSANNITAGAVDINSPAIGQTHGLTSSDLVTGIPALGSPILGTDNIHDLSAIGITTGQPIFGIPVIGQVHSLTAMGILTGFPVIGSPRLDFSAPATPVERVYTIAFENRTYAINYENRTLTA